MKSLRLYKITKGTSVELKKGTIERPYSEMEYLELIESEDWIGGYVEGKGWMSPLTDSTSSSGCSMPIGSANLILAVAEALLLSSFERKCLEHYMYGSGAQMELTEGDWSEIKSATSSAGYKSGEKFRKNGKEYYRKTVNYYNNSNLKWALGRASVTFSSSGTPVGIYDRYDFNALSAGNRPIFAECITRLLSMVHGTAYDIVYGIR